MIKTLLVDDEEYAIKNLSALIQLFCPELEVVGTARSAMSGLKMIQKYGPDLVFLDIDMPNHSGFDMLECIPERSFKTVFVTAYDQFALKAFSLQAMDYLLKPIDPNYLKRVAKRVVDMEGAVQNEQVKNVLSYAKSKELQKIAVPTANGIRFLLTSEIIYLEASSNYTKIHLKGEKPMLVSKTMKNFEKVLEEPDFARIHRTFMVNLHEVVEYTRSGGGAVEMSNGILLGVSKSHQKRMQQLLEQITNFL